MYDGSNFLAGAGVLLVVYVLWSILTSIQMFLGIGTAYRFAKCNGDNGVSLWGWMIVMNLAAMVPFLGIYLWKKHRYDDRASTSAGR